LLLTVISNEYEICVVSSKKHPYISYNHELAKAFFDFVNHFFKPFCKQNKLKLSDYAKKLGVTYKKDETKYYNDHKWNNNLKQ